MAPSSKSAAPSKSIGKRPASATTPSAPFRPAKKVQASLTSFFARGAATQGTSPVTQSAPEDMAVPQSLPNAESSTDSAASQVTPERHPPAGEPSLVATPEAASAPQGDNASRVDTTVDEDLFGDIDDAAFDEFHSASHAAQPAPAVSDGTTPDAIERVNSPSVEVNTVGSKTVSDGSSCPLNFAAILLYAVQMAFSVAQSLYTAEEFACLVELTAEGLTKLALKGMPPAVLAYIDECLSSGKAWDISLLMTMLPKHDATKGKHGIYLILLETFGDWLRTYCGSSWNVTKLGMYSRLAQHQSSDYRAGPKCTASRLYKTWDSVRHPVRSHAVGALCFVPASLAGQHGCLPVLVLETAMMSIFSPASRASTQTSMLPKSLLKMFSAYTGSAKDAQAAAFTKAASRTVMSVNQGLPVHEPHGLQRNLGLWELTDGLTTVVQVENGYDGVRMPLAFKTCVASPIKMTDGKSGWYHDLVANGFSLDRPYVTLTLEVADETHPECFAQVPCNTGTANNRLGYEMADRILLKASFVISDEQTGSCYVKHSVHSNARNELQRACMAMTLYDYSEHILPPPPAESFGRRRFNPYLSVAENEDLDPAPKVWDVTAPEMRDLLELKPFECKNPKCSSRFATLDRLKRHLGFMKSLKTVSERMLECRKESGFTSEDKVTAKAALAPDASLTAADQKPPRTMFTCRKCGQECPGRGALQ